MTRDEDLAFTEFLRQKATEAEALGYRPTQFKQMLASQGGDATVRQLLAKGKPSEGFGMHQLRLLPARSTTWGARPPETKYPNGARAGVDQDTGATMR